MRIGPFTFLLALSFASALLSQSTLAQTTKLPARKPAAPAATATPAKPTDAAAAAANSTSTAPAACSCPTPAVQVPRRLPPYSAKQKTTNVQTLANGTTITTVNESQVWRDADGRMRTESLNTLTGGSQYRGISIYDPIARVRMSWTVGMPNVPNVVNLYHMPVPQLVPQPVQPAPINPQPIRQPYYPYITESLPPQTIEGLYATGSRTTSTTPAGYIGNDHDLTTTRETWTAPSLGIQLRYISDDPRTGKSTTEVTDIQQTDPDPSLFKAPDGYQVKDTTPAPASTAAPAACNCSVPVVQHYRFYIAKQQMTHVQTLADGTTITAVTPMQEWRDDVGRERSESIRTLPDGTQYRDDSVYDPVARVRMNWTVGKPNTLDIVTVHPFPQPVTQPTTQAPVNPQPDRQYFPQSTESLQPQTIAGLYATGTRTTRTTPAGSQGNDQDIVTVDETWTSPDTGIQLRWTWGDEHMGKSTTEFTDIQFVDPDPAVFKAPDGYQVQEGNPR